MDRDCSAFKVRRLSRQVTQFYDQALRSEGLKSTQFHLLTVIGDEGPLTIGQLAERVGAERTSVTRAVQAIETSGLVEVGPGPDGRSKSVRLTRAGRALLDRVDPIREKQEEAFRRALAGVTSKRFIDDLVRAADRLQELIEQGEEH
ncbi:MAG: MarR family transcriptional regulator [Myxococcota bacterium]|jgi:DNA-binding MarR family transcriptional regulator|nr:MarR family transcriptional regulator [Myxococcota bacterium]